MSADVTRLAARRLAAQARNARRQAEADEAFEARDGDAEDTDMAASSSVRMIGTALDLADTRGGAAAAAASAAQSSHDQRREINKMIYGRLNVVEDGKAFEPQKFVSSRATKAKAAAEAAAAAAASAASASTAASSSRVQRVEDFMDDEDLADGQAGGAGTTSGAGLAARAAFKRPSAASAADGSGAFVAPASQGSIALQMLKAMGWRTGIPKKKARVYGAALPPGMGGADDESAAVEDEASALRSMMGADESDVALYASRVKNDTYGLGHTPYSQLNTAARNQHDQSGYAPLTFVRPKQLSTPEDLAVVQPKIYAIQVPDSFNCRHVFPVQEQAWQAAPPQQQPEQQSQQQPQPQIAQPAAPQQQLSRLQPPQQQQQSRQSNALITDWQSKMDASRRALVESLPRLPLPPMPPPTTSVPSTAAVAQPSATSAAPAPGVSALDLQRQRRLEAMAQAEQGGRPAPFGRMLNSQQQAQQPPSAASEHQPGRIDIRAAIAAAAERAAAMRAEREAEQRKAERRSKWGPLPPEAAAAVVDPAQFPLAAAFLSANFGDAPPPLPSLPLPPPPPPAAPAAAPAAFTVPPSLSALFPKFVVAGVQDPASGASSAASTSDTAAAASSTAKDDAMMDKFAPASSSTDAAAASTAAASSSSAAAATAAATAPIDPNSTGPYASYFAAARLKMFGKLTRRIEEWTPHNLVYKRFGVPVPQGNKQNYAASQRNSNNNKRTAAATAVSSAAGDSVPGFPSFVQSSTPFGSVSDPSAAAAAAVEPAAPVMSLAQIQAEIAREEEEALKAELARDNDDDKQQGGAATADSAPESKPSLDLFRAIFEASDDESESAPASLKHKKSAARKPQAQPAMQQPAPPAAAAAAAKSTPSSLVDSIFGSSAARPLQATPPVSSGFVHPDRLRQVPTAAAASSSGFAAPPSASAARPRDVISLEDEDDGSGDAEMSITGFSHKKPAAAASAEKFVPAGFRSKPVHFVPASGKPGPANAKAAAAASSRGDRLGGSGGGASSSYGEDDDVYGSSSSSSAPFGAVRGGLAPLAPAGSMEQSFRRGTRRDLSPEPTAPVLQHFLPPPVAAPRVAPVLPPPVPQSWPFAPQFGGLAGSNHRAPVPLPPPQQHATAHRPSAPPPTPAPAAAAASAADSSTLLSQLLDLHKALKSSKKHSASSTKEEEGSTKTKKEKKDKKDKRSKKHKKSSSGSGSKGGDKERKKKHRSRSRSRSRSKHHKRESKSHDSSSSSSDDSDVEVIERSKA